MTGNLQAAFAELLTVGDDEWIVSEPTEKKRGRPVGYKVPPKNSLGAAAVAAMTPLERKRNQRKRDSDARIDNIAILDMETDPFDNVGQMRIKPFLAVLYSDKFEPVIIWEENEDGFICAVVQAIEALPGKFTIYAHNGGRFDYLFLISRLRGKVSFKGRGIMSAQIGRHEIRDSFHIIPEALANWQKDKFNYSQLAATRRSGAKAEIIEYCLNDCRYLFDIVKAFVAGFGLKLTIGQAAICELRKHYDVKKFTEGHDAYIRQFFFGGRVECIRGRGEFRGDYKLYDVNSMYPYVMANYMHPIGDFWSYQIRYGEPGPDTVFVDLTCRNNRALVARAENGETTALIPYGRFRTTIWEYETALEFGLISDVKLNLCVDCTERSNFALFVNPLYDKRLTTKSELARMTRDGLTTSAAFYDMKKDDIFYKLLLNNGFGKYAQNPRNYKENYLTEPNEQPPHEWFKSLGKNPAPEFLQPVYEGVRYWIWEKPNPGFRFNNVGVAASITGAARAVLLKALQGATDAIYCDTDSIICRNLSGVHLDKTALGAWDLEDQFKGVIINGKKLYSVEHAKMKVRSPEQLALGLAPEYTVKSKGTAGLTWGNMQFLKDGGSIVITNRGPTINRFGQQYYVSRTIRATAPILTELHAP